MPPYPPRVKIPLRAIDSAGNAIEGVDIALDSHRASVLRQPRIFQNQAPDPALATPPYKSNILGEFSGWVERNDLRALLDHALLTTTEYFPAPLTHYHVREYGAKGDGSTDDRLAIQECVDEAAGNGIVFFDPGEYMVGGDQSVQVRANTHFDGCGQLSVVKRLDPGADDTSNDRPLFDTLTETSVDNIVFRNFTLDDNAAMNAGTGNFGGWVVRIKPTTGRGKHVMFDGMTIRNAWFAHFGTGIFNIDNAIVTNCNLYNGRRDGISVQGCNGAVILGNRVFNTGLGSLADPFDDGDDMISTWGTTRLVIVGNLLYSDMHERGRCIVLAGTELSLVADNHGYGGWRSCVGVEAFTGQTISTIAWNAGTGRARVTTVGNHGLTTGAQVWIDGTSVRGYNGLYTVTVADPVGQPTQFDLNGSTNQGSSTEGAATNAASVGLSDVKQSVIAHNTCENAGLYDPSGQWGDAVSLRCGGRSKMEDLTIIGNQSSDPTRHGIWAVIGNDLCSGIRILEHQHSIDRAAAHIVAADDDGAGIRFEGYGKIADLEIKGFRSKWTNSHGIYISCLFDVCDIDNARIANCGTNAEQKHAIRIEPYSLSYFNGDLAVTHNRAWDTQSPKGTLGLYYRNINGALRIESNDFRQTLQPVDPQSAAPAGGLIIDKNFGWNPWQGQSTVTGMSGTPRQGTVNVPLSPGVPSGSKLMVIPRTASCALAVTAVNPTDATVQATALVGTPSSCVFDWIVIPPS